MTFTSGNDMQIRPAEAGDIRDVAELHVAAWQHGYRGMVPDAYLNALSADRREVKWRKAFTEGSPELWVACNDWELTGWIAFGKCRDEDKPGAGELYAIHVSPSCWGCGIGHHLWEAAEKRLRESGYREVAVWSLLANARANRFYESIGFAAQEATREVTIGKVTLRARRYTMKLA